MPVHSRECGGFTLIEVLVTVLLLSVGALGTALLQMQALKATHAAYQRTLASVFAADVAERLWFGLVAGVSTDAWLADWQHERNCAEATGHVCLPGLQVELENQGNRWAISVSWNESRLHEPDSRAAIDYVVDVLPEPQP